MKKLILPVLVLALLLCGCGGPEPFDPVQERPPIELPEPQIDPDGAAEDVEESDAIIPELEPTVEETIPKLTVKEVRVEDRHCEVFTNPYFDGSYCVHIPQLVWDGQTDMIINEQIYFDHMGKLDKTAYEGQPMVSAAYSLGQNHGFVSVVTAFRHQDYEYVTYSIFHLNAATGQEANDDEILAAFGYTRDSFREKVRQVLEESFINGNAAIADMVGQEYYLQTLADNISDENVNAARPYIDEAGQLCVVANVYGFAGAGHYYNCICLETDDFYPTPQGIWCGIHG